MFGAMYPAAQRQTFKFNYAILRRKSFTDDVHSSCPRTANDSTIFHENDQAQNNVIIEKFNQLQD